MRAISQHLSSTQVADLLDERLDPGDRDSVITHLSTCAECRHEVAELHGALSRANERRPRARWIAGAAIAAAAVVALVTVPRLTSSPAMLGDKPGSTRTSPAAVESPVQIRIVQPADSAVVSSAVVFTWRSAGTDASYILTVQDGAGAMIWSTTVSDTSAALPASVKLASGTPYFWSVDARLADGSAAGSAAHSFNVR